MIFLSGRPEMFFVVSASIRGPSVMKCFPTDQKISRKKKKYSKRCVAPILKQKEALPSRTCSFFRSFERHVTYSNCGGEKETKIFSGNVPRAPPIIIEHYRPEVDKASWQGNFINESLNEGSQRSCRPFRGQLPTARFCVSTITHFKEKNGKNVVIWEIRTARSHLQLWPGVWVDREGR